MRGPGGHAPGILAIAFLLAHLCLPPAVRAQRWIVGLAGGGTPIEALASEGTPEDAPIVLVVGGLDGDPASADRVLRAFEAHRTSPRRTDFRLIAIPSANPEAGPMTFPPTGTAYRENPESHALWRWIGVRAPDLVLIAGDSDFGLADALSSNSVAGVGRIPALRVGDPGGGVLDSLPDPIPPSEARIEMRRRLSRTPDELARELAGIYGHDFSQVTYIPGMALIGRLRLGEEADVLRLAAPYLDAQPAIRSSLNIAGHLVFAELAERTGDARYLGLARRAADLGFGETGEMLEAMPFHNEMSDAFFMAGPILARTGRLTGETRYFDMAARHLRFMEDLVLRPDGLFRHSPLTDAAWSRGNAFPALGMALTLADFPETHPAFPTLAAAFRQHMAALGPFQDPDGMWHEVIDYPGSYAELSSTAMIATAMLEGVRRGWLDREEYLPRVEAAWTAVLARTGADGVLIDVCESTNKQASLEAYLDREAILGRDDRGGGMVLMFATEMAGLE